MTVLGLPKELLFFRKHDLQFVVSLLQDMEIASQIQVLEEQLGHLLTSQGSHPSLDNPLQMDIRLVQSQMADLGAELATLIFGDDLLLELVTSRVANSTDNVQDRSSGKTTQSQVCLQIRGFKLEV